MKDTRQKNCARLFTSRVHTIRARGLGVGGCWPPTLSFTLAAALFRDASCRICRTVLGAAGLHSVHELSSRIDLDGPQTSVLRSFPMLPRYSQSQFDSHLCLFAWQIGRRGGPVHGVFGSKQALGLNKCQLVPR